MKTFANIVLCLVSSANAFAPGSISRTQLWTQTVSTNGEPAVATVAKAAVQELGLLTFDLDDTLYPVSDVIEEANAAFADAMEKYGFPEVSAFDIVETGKKVREEMATDDPEAAAALSHTEIRELAIRREMQQIIMNRKLQQTADSWATPVESLTSTVKIHAETWAKNAVSESIVQSVLTAWEMARHHAAERFLFPHVVDSIKRIKEEHPNVIIGAVTDGRANPLLMTFTLAPYFDFCMSWEDDQGSRRRFFKELGEVGEKAELTWIYDAARHQYAILKQAHDAMNAAQMDEEIKPLTWPDHYDDLAWIHVGDDLAFDIGGSSECGAKTVYVEMPKSSGQTAPFRFDLNEDQPFWSTTTRRELETRIRMNEAAREHVDIQINTMERLPIAINQLLAGEA